MTIHLMYCKMTLREIKTASLVLFMGSIATLVFVLVFGVVVNWVVDGQAGLALYLHEWSDSRYWVRQLIFAVSFGLLITVVWTVGRRGTR